MNKTPAAGWYSHRRAGSHRLSRAHFFAQLETYVDAFGRRNTLAHGPSACGRIKPGAFLSLESAAVHPNSCHSCRAALGLD